MLPKFSPDAEDLGIQGNPVLGRVLASLGSIVSNKSTIVSFELLLTAACHEQYKDLLPNIFDLINRI